MVLTLLSPLVAAPWVGGYAISIDGYHGATYEDHEYWNVDIITNIVPGNGYTPAVRLGFRFPPLGYNSRSFLTLGAETTVAVWREHPLRDFFRRSSAYAPKVGASIAFALGEMSWAATEIEIAPLRLQFGDKSVSVLALRALYDVLSEQWGWGVRIFEIQHFLW